ncbi:MAG: hypothetical protein RBR32_12770 [Bacteroidales bacterium]|nr:hypothetical protein [Bacteroidales bacterium]
MKNSRLKFVWKVNKKHLIALLVLIGVLIFIIGCFDSFVKEFSGSYWDILEPALTLILIGISVSIWLNEQNENWRDSLSKKLNITYIIVKNKNANYEDDWFCKVYNAPLTHEGDIRHWGLSIAQTILEGARIDFLGFNIKKPSSSTLINKEKVMLYELEVFIKKEIEGINHGDKYEFDNKGCFIKNNR